MKEYFNRVVLGKVLVLPRKSAEQFTCDVPWSCISISDPFAYFDADIHEGNRVGLLRMRFDDAQVQYPRAVLFNKEMASQVIEFVDKVWANSELLMIHCNAGMCRSPAVGQFVAERYEPSYAQYYKRLYAPNMLVYNVLKEYTT